MLPLFFLVNLISMRNYHLFINLSCFITIIISLSYGMSIFNAYDNQHITHLNLQDHFSFYPIEEVPVLTAKAVIISAVFVTISFGLQIFTYFKSKLPKRKTIILILLPIYLILYGFSGYVISDTSARDFYSYGMIWVLLNLCLIFGNSILLFVKEESPKN